MQRIQLYLKVVIDADDDERPDKLGRELYRLLKKFHGVTEVEVTNTTSEPFEEPPEED